MKILFTICGRAGSKGIKNKNCRTFCGKYLVYYTISVIDLYLKKHPDIEYDLVARSDSLELLRIVSGNPLRPIEEIVRDEALAGDSIGKITVVKDCFLKMEEQKSIHYDMVVDLDITSPQRMVVDLGRTIEIQFEKGTDVTTTVATARRNPYFNQVRRMDHGVKWVIESTYTTRQQEPDIFDMNAFIYAHSPEYLISGKGVLDGYCEIVEMYNIGILENDFELMEVIAQYLFTRSERFRVVYTNIPCKFDSEG